MSANCADREVYTVRVDSFGVSGNYSTFQAFLDVPLRNVVKAELIMASMHQQFSNAICHVYVEELTSKFISRAGPAYNVGVGRTTSNVGVATQIANRGLVDRAFVSIPTSNVTSAGSDFRVIWTMEMIFQQILNISILFVKSRRLHLHFWMEQQVFLKPWTK